MWFGIVKAVSVIMALSEGKNNPKCLQPYSFVLRGVLFVINHSVFCHKERFRISPVNFGKKIIQAWK